MLCENAGFLLLCWLLVKNVEALSLLVVLLKDGGCANLLVLSLRVANVFRSQVLLFVNLDIFLVD